MAKFKLVLNKKVFVPIYYPYVDKFDKPVEIYFGSRNSAKSYFITQKLLKIALSDPYSVTLCVREMRNSLKGTCFKTFSNILREWRLLDKCKVNSTDLVITLPNNAIIEFVGIDNVDSIKSKPIISRIFYEECDRLTADAYETISGSLRGQGHVQGEFFAFNPPQNEFFLFSLYLHNINLEELYEKKIIENESVRVFHTTWRDNPFQDLHRLEVKYNNLKERDYYRWLRDSEGRMGTAQEEDCIFTTQLLMDSLEAELHPHRDEEIVFAIDCARFGDDSTVISYRQGYKVNQPIQLRNKRGHDIADKLYYLAIGFAEKQKFTGKIVVNIDGTGLGASTVDALYKMKKEKSKYPYIDRFKINDINFSNKAFEEDLYHDIISESAFKLKELLLDRKVQLPKCEPLIEELGMRKRLIDNKNRDQLEVKKDFKKRIGKSPDFMDSCLLLFVGRKKRLIFL